MESEPNNLFPVYMELPWSGTTINTPVKQEIPNAVFGLINIGMKITLLLFNQIVVLDSMICMSGNGWNANSLNLCIPKVGWNML